MDHFYFIRHGQTDANLRGLLCGCAWDIDINETGIQQAKQAARIIEKYEDIRVICSSPLRRTKQTTQIVNEKFNRPIIYITDLREWDLGDWDRVPFEKLKHLFLGDGEPENGEKRAEFQTRVASALEKCRQQTQPILIVSHGGVALAMQTILNINSAKVENGKPYRFFQKGNHWHFEELT